MTSNSDTLDNKMSTKYKRVLVKISGEQLAGEFETGVDTKFAAWFAKEIKKAADAGCQIVIVAGGGNMARGTEVAHDGIKRVTGDQMGMLAGLINAIALTDIFEANNVRTRCLSNIFAEQVAESYSFRLAEKHLQKGRVVIIAGGVARPYFTHDMAGVSLALELNCEVFLKATKVDGVYDKDPKKHTDAKRHDSIAFQHALENQDIKVMDKAALGLAMEHNMPTIIYNAVEEDNLLKLVQGKKVGTTIA